MSQYLWRLKKNISIKNRNLVVGVIYRPPGTDMKLFNEDINSLLNLLKNENKLCYLMGDYNINLLNYGKHSDTTEFVDILHGHSFISLISRPTRVKQQSVTLIDNIFTNCYLNIENTFQCIIYTDIRDHFPIIHVDNEMKEINTGTYVVQRNRLVTYACLNMHSNRGICIHPWHMHINTSRQLSSSSHMFKQIVPYRIPQPVMTNLDFILNSTSMSILNCIFT